MDDVWAYNTETNELVQAQRHPEMIQEELAREHLVDHYPFVIYFFAELVSA